MNQTVIEKLQQINDKIAQLLSQEEVSEIDSLQEAWQERDKLLKRLCHDKNSLIEHKELINSELTLTNEWLSLIRSYSSKLGKDLLSSTRNQKAIRKYQR